MPRQKRKVTEWTTEEAERKLFPKKVVEEVHRIVEEHDQQEQQRPSQKQSSTE